MLLFFALENWMSYRKAYAFSMLATENEIYSSHLATINGDKKVLPISIVFGGNASGKSNLFDAIAYLEGLLMGYHSLADGSPFLLDEKRREEPSSFQIDFLYEEIVRRYQLSISRDAVIYEALHKIDPAHNQEETIFIRQEDNLINCNNLDANCETIARDFLKEKTKDQLLIRELAPHCSHAQATINWFDEILTVQNSRFSRAENYDLLTEIDRQPKLLSLINKLLPLLDSGIDHFEIRNGDNKHLIAVHKDSLGKEIAFPLRHEAAGVRHLLEILPPLILSLDKDIDSSKVMVIDEWDRNLHSLLTIELLNFFLQQREANMRSQLIISSHDLNLLNHELFRSDELWITERLSDGSSVLVPLSDFRALRDDDVDYRQLYIEGRLGGIPNLNAFLLSDWPHEDSEEVDKE